MSSELIDAHATLDMDVDKLFGLERLASTELVRQDMLFTRYQEMTSPLDSAATRGGA